MASGAVFLRANPGAVVMAKTDWICRQIEKNHKIPVHKIWPSIDHATYHPGADLALGPGGLTISAMIRPTTPRRGAVRTMALLGRLKDVYQDQVAIKIFGCSETTSGFSDLRRDFEFENLGVLKRGQVADVLRASDIFLDLSDYQAFGRTGLEAMACNTVVMVPLAGGADDYARDGYNALVVDTFDLEACFQRLKDLIAAPEKIAKMRLAALETANGYSPRRAAISELVLFATELAERRALHPAPSRKRVALLPALTNSQVVTITGSGYVRLLSPYRQDALAETWETRVFLGTALPQPGEADIAVVQRDLPASLRAEFTPWLRAWRAAGGRLIYEIDDDLTDVAALKARDHAGGAEDLARRVRAYLEAADLITVSTPHLAALFQQHAAKIMVVPNRIDAELWKCPLPQGRAEPDRIRIGYVGTPTHTEDLRSIQQVMLQLDQRADVSVEVIGAFQKIEPLFGRRIGLPHNSVYPVFTEWLQQVARWDIAIIPLVDDAFNRAKSYLKFVECAALGTAILCSDTAEYRQVATDGENCLLVPNEPAAWLQALTRLIEDPGLRHRLAAKAHAEAYQSWTVQRHADLYHSVLSRALYARTETR